MVKRDNNRFPRKPAPRTPGGGIRQWDRFDFIAMLCVPVALYCVWQLTGDYLEGRHMRSWVEVPAHVESLDIHKIPNRYEDIPRIACKYCYEYQGKLYGGRRVTIRGEKDDPWDDAWYDRLDALSKSGDPLPCYVNP